MDTIVNNTDRYNCAAATNGRTTCQTMPYLMGSVPIFVAVGRCRKHMSAIVLQTTAREIMKWTLRKLMKSGGEHVCLARAEWVIHRQINNNK